VSANWVTGEVDELNCGFAQSDAEAEGDTSPDVGSDDDAAIFAVSPHPAVAIATTAHAPATSVVRITKLILDTPPKHRSTGFPRQR
jgi:hypothetical protein